MKNKQRLSDLYGDVAFFLVLNWTGRWLELARQLGLTEEMVLRDDWWHQRHDVVSGPPVQ